MDQEKNPEDQVEFEDPEEQEKVGKVLGGAVTEILRKVSQEIAERKADDTVTARQYMLVSKLLNGETVYSLPYNVGVGLEVTLRNLNDEHIGLSRVLAVKNPDARAKGEEVEVDVTTESLMQIVMSLVKLNDEDFPILDPPKREDYATKEGYGTVLNKFLDEVYQRSREFNKWPGPMKRNVFLGLSRFFSELDTLYENKTLENFLKPPMDISSEKDSIGESMDTE